MKLTAWYSGDQNPARKGVYQRDFSHVSGSKNDFRYSHWDGGGWRLSQGTAKGAAERGLIYSGFQNLSWRGVAE